MFSFQLCLNEGEISFALGGKIPTFHLGLIGFSLLYSPIGLMTGVMMNIFSRKNEYEADKFAKDTYDGKQLSLALKKLSANNLSNLHPHPFYAFIHYSHPPLLKRLNALKNKNMKKIYFLYFIVNYNVLQSKSNSKTLSPGDITIIRT